MESVQKGTAAEKAGIHGGNINGSVEGGQVAVGGDIIVSIDGKPVASSEDLANDIEAEETGRDGRASGCCGRTGKGAYEHKTVSVKLGERPNSVPNPKHARRLDALALAALREAELPATVGACPCPRQPRR